MKKDFFSENGKIAGLSKRIRAVFDDWNYEEIFLPFMEEYTDSLRGGLKHTDGKRFYLIKPDVTSQIIDRMKQRKTYRYFYFSDYFLGDGSCSIQFGAEFVGANPLQEKVEILQVVASILRAVDVSDFYVDVGSLKHLNEILAKIPERRREAMEALKSRNFTVIEDMNIDEEFKEALWKIFSFRGRKSGIPQLDGIVDHLPEEHFFIDTGTVRYLDYYEDIVFEVYTPSSGKALGGGGDYAVKEMAGFGFSMDLRGLAEIAPFNSTMIREQSGKKRRTKYAEVKNPILNEKTVEVTV